MAASETTRLLVLGVTQIFGPANGYQLRRELLSWGIESWANINPGSVYSMLSTLTKLGLVERVDITAADGGRPVAVYSITPAGRIELDRLVRDGITVVQTFDRTTFYAALSLMSVVLERATVVEVLVQRVAALRQSVQSNSAHIAAIESSRGAPPHVPRLIGYAVGQEQAEITWIESMIAEVTAGEMTFAGEPTMEKWEPLPGDPAWRMVGERAAYLEKLGRQE